MHKVISLRAGPPYRALLVGCAATSLMFGLSSTLRAQVKEQSIDSSILARTLFMQYRLREALPIFAAIAAKETGNPDAHAWLAATAMRLREYDLAAGEARSALRLVPCHAFAHSVLGDIFLPQTSRWKEANADSGWIHLLKAAECDSSDGNPWFGILGEAMRRGEQSLESKSLQRLVATKFLEPGVLAYGRWLLRGLPANAVLLTSGDLDTFGVLAVQNLEHFRVDIAVVNSNMLVLDWYQDLMSQRYSLPLGPAMHSGILSSDSLLAYWRRKSLDKSLRRQLTSNLPQVLGTGRFAFAGAYWLLTLNDSIADATIIRRAFDDVRGADFALPVANPRDRSPLRHMTWIPEMVVVAGFHSADVLRRAGQDADASQRESWTRRFGEEAGLSLDAVQHLRDLLK